MEWEKIAPAVDEAIDKQLDAFLSRPNNSIKLILPNEINQIIVELRNELDQAQEAYNNSLTRTSSYYYEGVEIGLVSAIEKLKKLVIKK